MRQAGLRELFLQRVERRQQPVAVGMADERGQRLALGGQLLRHQIATARRARGVAVGEFAAQHPPREQKFGGMVFEPLCRCLREAVRQRRERTEQQVAMAAERAARLGEECRAVEARRSRRVGIETGIGERAQRSAGREQPLPKVMDRGIHGYWRFTLIDPTLRIESSSVIDAL